LVISIRLILAGTAMIVVLTGSCASPQGEKPSRPVRTPAASSPTLPDFDPARSFQDLSRVAGFGPRNAGSPGHQQCLTYIGATLSQLADSVATDQFMQEGYDGEVLRLTNIFASFNPHQKTRVLLCTHWDTRPRAERDPRPERRNEPIVGANDGASGVAVLLELARCFREHAPPIGVDLVFFDGEDYGREGDLTYYLLGSRRFAATKPDGYMPRFGILLDMIGDAQLELPKESHSVSYAPDVVDLVWNTARQLGFHQFSNSLGDPITDDHLPLNLAGIRTIDLIDFSYPDESHRYWHTHDDTPDKCSPESLNVIGTVLLHVLYSLSPDE